jgi:hypothetical protein
MTAVFPLRRLGIPRGTLAAYGVDEWASIRSSVAARKAGFSPRTAGHRALRLAAVSDNGSYIIIVGDKCACLSARKNIC